MKKVIFKGFFDGDTGYIVASKKYPLAIKEAGIECEIEPLRPLEEKNPLKDMVVKDKSNSLTILHQVPDTSDNEEAYFTVTEVDIPQTRWWIPFSRAKLILTQSTFCKKAFARIPGVDGNKIHVVNFILDDIYKPEGEIKRLYHPIDGDFLRPPPFIIGSAFDWVIRKKPEIMWKAFIEEFPLKEYPMLLFVNRMTIIPQHTKWKYEFNQYTEKDPRITFITQKIDDMPSFYRSLDCYCSPTAGEGWGATLCEAMACGIPTIGSRYSGNLDFMNDTNSYLTDVGDWEYIGNEAYKRNSYQYDYQRWKVPKIAGIRKAMREIYELKMSGKPNQRALEGKKVAEKYTIKNAAAQFKAALEDYL